MIIFLHLQSKSTIRDFDPNEYKIISKNNGAHL
jgi:hypothetical protein